MSGSAISLAPRARRFAEAKAGNLRALRAERRARCWGRPGCAESPTLLLLHQGEQEPFGTCLACGERLLTLRSFSVAGDAA